MTSISWVGRHRKNHNLLFPSSKSPLACSEAKSRCLLILSPNYRWKLSVLSHGFSTRQYCTDTTDLQILSWALHHCIRFHLAYCFSQIYNTLGCWFCHILYLAPLHSICKSDKHTLSSKIVIKKTELKAIIKILRQAQRNPFLDSTDPSWTPIPTQFLLCPTTRLTIHFAMFFLRYKISCFKPSSVAQWMNVMVWFPVRTMPGCRFDPQ